jgi:hypothetical protein
MKHVGLYSPLPECQRANSDEGPPPRPLSRKRVCPPPPLDPKGGGEHSLVGEGAGGANSDDWRESLALCQLYVSVSTLLSSRVNIYYVIFYSLHQGKR